MSLSDFIDQDSQELGDSYLDTPEELIESRKISYSEKRFDFLKNFFKFLDLPILNPTLSGYFFKIFNSFMN